MFFSESLSNAAQLKQDADLPIGWKNRIFLNSVKHN